MEYVIDKLREQYKQDMGAFLRRKHDLASQLEQEEEDLWQNFHQEVAAALSDASLW